MQENANLEAKPDPAKPPIFGGSRLPAHATRLDHELFAWFRLGLSELDASTLAARFPRQMSAQLRREYGPPRTNLGFLSWLAL